jgi:pSer/pThr/pTyr-binding forkhead associated (FHA) protein
VLLGRTGDNDVAIPEYSISKRHCFFEFQPGQTLVCDCGSTNGTLLNGTKLEPKTAVQLKGGELITLGRYAFMFQTAVGFLDYVRTLAAGR